MTNSRPIYNFTPSIIASLSTVFVVTALFAMIDKYSWSAIIFVFCYCFLVLGTTLYLTKAGAGFHDRIFSYGIFVRIVIIIAWSAYPPTGADYIGLFYSPGVVFPDEAYYIATANKALSSGLWDTISFGNAYERIAFYYGVIFSMTGEELIWGRLVNAFVSALASLFIYDTIRRSTPPSIHRTAWWVAAFAPVLIILPCTYLKESILILGVAILINSGFVLSQGERRFKYWFMILCGSALCFFARGETMILLLPFLALSYWFGRSHKSNGRLFWIVLIGTAISIVILSFFLYDVAPLLNREGTIETRDEIIGSGKVRFPLFEFVTGLPREFHVIGFTLILMISPLITGLWQLIPFLGEPSWIIAVKSAYAVTWWVSLPLLFAATWVSIRKRDGWWMLASCIFLVWVFISATMRFGAGTDAFRYREAFLPLTLLLATRGLHFINFESNRPDRWRLLLKIYFIMILGLIILRGLGILSMAA